MVRAAILVSGNGMLLQSVLDAMYFGEIPDFELVAVICTDVNAYAMRRAKNAKVESIVVEPENFPTKFSYSMAISNKLKHMDIDLVIHPGMSFVEVLYTRLGVDPVEGLMILDAEDVAKLHERPFTNLVITQVYDERTASDCKLSLMEFLPDDAPVTFIHNLALPDESVRTIYLYELDRQKDIDHLTTLFVPRKA